jgi:putative peptidoglycan lipid II flippase
MNTPAPQAGWTGPERGRGGGHRRAPGRRRATGRDARADQASADREDVTPGYRDPRTLSPREPAMWPGEAYPAPGPRPRNQAYPPPGYDVGGYEDLGYPDPGYRDPGHQVPASGGPGRGPEGPGPEGPGPEGPSLTRSSGIMALGTLASRGTGFLRTLVTVYALGYTLVANAYNNANTLPNAVYDLMLGGILSAVVVPLLVTAAKRNRDAGEAYSQRMFTLATIALFGLTLVATLAAALLVGLYAHALTGAERHLTVIFAYFFIPQIFFYGVSSMAGGILNARGSFAAPMWTPVLNNIVVIVVLLMFMATGGIGANPADISTAQVQLLGFGTTLGIIVQTAALIPALRRVGFRWRPRFDFRRAEVTEIRRMAAPLFGYIVTTQVSFLVVQNVANAASTHVSYDSFSTYTYAWMLFQLPYAVVGVSVITALLPRMSAHAAERQFPLVRSDFSTGVRLASAVVVPAALLLLVLGPPLAEFLFGIAHGGSTTVAENRYTGEVFGAFSLFLVPYMMFQLLLRVFYALHDSRTPMFIGVATMIVNSGASLLALYLLPAGHVVAGLGVAFGLGNLAGTLLAWRIASRKLGGLAGHEISRTLVRMHLAALPALLFAWAVTFMVGVLLAAGPAYGLVTVVLGGGGGLFLYFLFCRALHVREVTDLLGAVRARLGR